MTTNILKRYRRIRVVVRLTLTLGVAASIVANVLHAEPNPISQAIAAWAPLALLLCVELISRVPVHRRGHAFIRMTATAVIASIAAWVSYWHMVDVVARYGETGATPYLLPISVDGLIVVASICLVEIGHILRRHEQPHHTTTHNDAAPTTQPDTNTNTNTSPEPSTYTPANTAPVRSDPVDQFIAGLNRPSSTPELPPARPNHRQATPAGIGEQEPLL